MLEQEIWQRYREHELHVVAIQVKEDARLASSFATRHGWTFPVLVDDAGAVSERFAHVKEGLPSEVAIINAHFVLDSDGVVVHRDFLNMEKFDAKAANVPNSLDDFPGKKS